MQENSIPATSNINTHLEITAFSCGFMYSTFFPLKMLSGTYALKSTRGWRRVCGSGWRAAPGPGCESGSGTAAEWRWMGRGRRTACRTRRRTGALRARGSRSGRGRPWDRRHIAARVRGTWGGRRWRMTGTWPPRGCTVHATVEPLAVNREI